MTIALTRFIAVLKSVFGKLSTSSPAETFHWNRYIAYWRSHCLGLRLSEKTCTGQAGVFKANSSYNKCAHMENITLELLCHVDHSSPGILHCLALYGISRKRVLFGIVSSKMLLDLLNIM